MKINANELMDYYSKATISFFNTVSDAVPSGLKGEGGSTYPRAGGIIIPIEGSACFTFNRTPYVMTPGMVIHAGPDMRLDKEVIGNKPWRYALVHYKIPEHEYASFPYYHTHFNIPVGTNPRLMDMLLKLLASDTTQGGQAVLRCRSLFYHLIEEIVVSAKRQQRDNVGELIDDATAFIHENYSRQFTIAQLAAQYGMDGKRFAELFQRHIGMTPVRYLTDLRIERSKELLRISNCPVMQVAECVGYIDSYYFSRIFKKVTGISPTDFRVEAQAGKV